MNKWKLIVGLGNPGSKYAGTRHNIGADFVRRLANFNNVNLSENSKFFAETGRINELNFLLPKTYMNESGKAVGAFANFYRFNSSEILILHDELDLLPGEIRLKQGGSNAGHNGLRSIDEQIPDKNYWRLRIGIGHPRSLNLPFSVADFVLSPPRPCDEVEQEEVYQLCQQNWRNFLNGDITNLQRNLHPRKAIKSTINT